LISEGDSDPLSSEFASWTLEPGELLLEKLLAICPITKPKGRGDSASGLHHRCGPHTGLLAGALKISIINK